MKAPLKEFGTGGTQGDIAYTPPQTSIIHKRISLMHVSEVEERSWWAIYSQFQVHIY